MPVTVICPNLNCGKPIMAPDSMRGKVCRCAHCNKPFIVPINARSVVSQEGGKPEEPKSDK